MGSTIKTNKLYDSERNGTFYMMFGVNDYNRISLNNKKVYPKKKKYYYEDKRTKKYGKQRVELLKKNK